MFLRTELIEERKFVGDRISMSLTHNRTFELWSAFRPKVSAVSNRISTDFISLQVYPSLEYFRNFSLNAEFEKFALVEVDSFVESQFNQVTINDTLYAVFLHKGTSEDFPMTMNYIMSDWLPNSNYELTDAPHFEVLGKRYKKENPDSEEEIWIPIVERQL